MKLPLILNGPNNQYGSMQWLLHGSRVYPEKSTVDLEWPKRLSKENENFFFKSLKLRVTLVYSESLPVTPQIQDKRSGIYDREKKKKEQLY